MTVKFKDPLSAQACVIVSATVSLLHCDTMLILATENERSILLRPADRSIPVRRQTAVQAERAEQ